MSQPTSIGNIKYLLWLLVVLALLTGVYLIENLMTSLHQAAVIAIRPIKDGVSRSLKVEDVRYSEAPNAFLDVYRRPSGESDRPVFVFIHGGFYQGGFRRHYRNLGGWAHRRGYVSVLIDYPAIHGMISRQFASAESKATRDYFAQESAVAAALQHIQANAHEWGGSANQLLVAAHGSGGQLLLAALLDKSRDMESVEKAIQGMLLFSPIVDLTIDDPLLRDRFLPVAFGPHQDKISDNSPVQNIRAFNFPISLLAAENDLPYMTDSLARFQASAPSEVKLKISKGLSHQTLLFKLGRKDFPDTDTINRFADRIFHSSKRTPEKG